MPKVRAKSSPVPHGTTASSHSAPSGKRPFTPSLTVPSPPTTTTSSAPATTALRVKSTTRPGASLSSASPSRPSSAALATSSGQRLPADQLPAAGLTTKAVLMGLGRDRAERELGHLVDGGAHLLVRDADELTLDDDVADREEAARLDLAQSAEREQHGGLHLDGEDAAVRPALVLTVVGVVEEVARDDGADAQALAHLLRGVHGAVDELPVRGRRVRLADEVPRGRIGRDGRHGHDQVAE